MFTWICYGVNVACDLKIHDYVSTVRKMISRGILLVSNQSCRSRRARLDPELDDLLRTSVASLLDNSAAKHKLAVRPRKKHSDARHRDVASQEETRWESVPTPSLTYAHFTRCCSSTSYVSLTFIGWVNNIIYIRQLYWSWSTYSPMVSTES